MPKRSAEEQRTHLLYKIKRLETKILKLPETDCEANDILEEGQIADSETDFPPEEELLDAFLEDEGEHLEESNETLDEEILNVLGSAPTPQPKKEILHKQIANRWNEILDKGLKKEEKENIIKENPTFENIPKMLAPKLNKEVSAALNENARKRDQLIENRQKQISSALACVGQALQLCLGDNIQEQRVKVIKKINESGRLLCDSLFLESKGRRSLVLSTINKDLKDSLSEAEIGEYLFGENLTEKIKTAKAVQKSSKDLKIEEKKKPFIKRTDTSRKDNNRTLNWRGPPRVGMQPRFQRGGGPAYNRPQTVKKSEDRGLPRRGRK